MRIQAYFNILFELIKLKSQHETIERHHPKLGEDSLNNQINST